MTLPPQSQAQSLSLVETAVPQLALCPRRPVPSHQRPALHLPRIPQVNLKVDSPQATLVPQQLLQSLSQAQRQKGLPSLTLRQLHQVSRQSTPAPLQSIQRHRVVSQPTRLVHQSPRFRRWRHPDIRLAIQRARLSHQFRPARLLTRLHRFHRCRAVSAIARQHQLTTLACEYKVARSRPSATSRIDDEG